MSKKMTQEEFIKRGKELFPNLDFSKAVFKGSLKPVTVICPIHGEYQTLANNLLHNSLLGCPKCGIEERKVSREEFIKRATKRFGDKYNYSQVVMENTKTEVTVICPIHGPFRTRPSNFLNSKVGCLKCSYRKNHSNDSAK